MRDSSEERLDELRLQRVDEQARLVQLHHEESLRQSEDGVQLLEARQLFGPTSRDTTRTMNGNLSYQMEFRDKRELELFSGRQMALLALEPVVRDRGEPPDEGRSTP